MVQVSHFMYPRDLRLRKKILYDSHFEYVVVIGNTASECLVLNCQFNKLFSLSFLFTWYSIIFLILKTIVFLLLKSFLNCLQNDIQTPWHILNIFPAKPPSISVSLFPWPWPHTLTIITTCTNHLHFPIYFSCLSTFVCCDSTQYVTHTLLPDPHYPCFNLKPNNSSKIPLRITFFFLEALSFFDCQCNLKKGLCGNYWN